MYRKLLLVVRCICYRYIFVFFLSNNMFISSSEVAKLLSSGLASGECKCQLVRRRDEVSMLLDQKRQMLLSILSVSSSRLFSDNHGVVYSKTGVVASSVLTFKSHLKIGTRPRKFMSTPPTLTPLAQVHTPPPHAISPGPHSTPTPR